MHWHWGNIDIAITFAQTIKLLLHSVIRIRLNTKYATQLIERRLIAVFIRSAFMKIRKRFNFSIAVLSATTWMSNDKYYFKLKAFALNFKPIWNLYTINYCYHTHTYIYIFFILDHIFDTSTIIVSFFFFSFSIWQ